MIKIWTIKNFDLEELPEWVAQHFIKLKPYVSEFLTARHPYRNGMVCPFVSRAIKDDEIYFTYYEDGPRSNITKLIDLCIYHYQGRISRTPGSIIIIFREDFNIPSLLRFHIAHKERCIKNHLMLGALYAESSAESLHSNQYFPLRTPTPTLVLRELTASDLIFWTRNIIRLPHGANFYRHSLKSSKKIAELLALSKAK